MKSVSRTVGLAVCATALGFLFAPSTILAQVTATAPAATGSDALQRFDLEGGAAYSHFNPGYAHQVRATNLVGWQGAATAWLGKSYGIEGVARGVYGNYDLPVAAAAYGIKGTSSMSEHIFLFGPTFRLLQTQKYTAGGHLLIGGAYGNFDKAFAGTGIQPTSVGVYNTQLAFAYAIGGWADYNLTPKFAIRFTGDYQPTHYGGTTQNEFAGAVGIVYKLGQRAAK